MEYMAETGFLENLELFNEVDNSYVELSPRIRRAAEEEIARRVRREDEPTLGCPRL